MNKTELINQAKEEFEKSWDFGIDNKQKKANQKYFLESQISLAIDKTLEAIKLEKKKCKYFSTNPEDLQNYGFNQACDKLEEIKKELLN